MMNSISIALQNLAKQLFAKGRAFWIPVDTKVETFLKTFDGDGANRMGTLERLQYDANRLLDSLLPDNDNFTDGTINPTDNDCNDWEGRLGLIQYGITSADTPTRLQRMAMIAQKMRYPGTVAPRQSAEYLETCLQNAGFDVHVYENIFAGGTARSPGSVIGPTAANHRSIMGFFQHGENQHGELSGNTATIIANYVDEATDSSFVIDTSWRGIFFIAGITSSTFADISEVRKNAFRQMILQLKPAHLAGVLLINYT